MDHRCLYGHRVPAEFTFAIRSRSCPVCGAATVTVAGYQAARKLTSAVGLEPVTAFNVIGVLEQDWALVAATPPEAPVRPAATPLVAIEAPAPTPDEEVIVEEDTAPPEPRALAGGPSGTATITPVARPLTRGFDAADEDFFKSV